MNNSAINLAINSNIGFTLLKWRSRRCPGVWITDIDYADQITVIADTVDDITPSNRREIQYYWTTNQYSKDWIHANWSETPMQRLMFE